MKYLPSLSIRQITILFPTVMLVALIGFWVAFDDLTEYQEAFSDHVIYEDLPTLQRLSKNSTAFQGIERDLYVFLLDVPRLDTESIYLRGQDLIDRIDYNWGQFKLDLSHAEHHSDAHIERLYMKTTKSAEELRTALVEITRLASVDPANAQTLLPKVSLAASTFTECVNDQVQEIRNSIAAQLKHRSATMGGQLQHTVYRLALFALLVSAIVIGLIVLIRTNLKKIYFHLRTMADKEFDVQVLPIIRDRDFSALNEVAQTLFDTHTQLSEANKALASERDKLDQRVKARTQDLEEINRNLAREVLQRRLAESKIRLYQTVVEQAKEAVIITDADNVIVDVNDAYLKVTGFSREEVIGKNPRITKSGHHDKAFYLSLWSAIERNGHWSGEIWDRRKNGEVFPTWLSINVIKNDEGEVTNHVGIFIDITEQKKTEQELEQLAFNDPLTGVANRTLFYNRLSHELNLGERQNWQVVLFFIDLDHFKEVNDTFGHNVGDKLLVEVSKRILETMRKSDTVARLGGDEFAVILPGHTSMEDITTLAKRVVNLLQAPYDIDDNHLNVGASIGISVYPHDAQTSGNLIETADKAMYLAKQSGRGTFKFVSDIVN